MEFSLKNYEGEPMPKLWFDPFAPGKPTYKKADRKKLKALKKWKRRIRKLKP